MAIYKIVSVENTNAETVTVTVQKEECCTTRKVFHFKKGYYTDMYVQELSESQNLMKCLYEEHKGETHFCVGFSLFNNRFALTYSA